ncbi:MAG: hypothetical protein ACYDH6_19330 [Acidimicrobiales bacterium]
MTSPSADVRASDRVGDTWAPGSRVAVRNRFTGAWTAGFRIEDAPEREPTAFRIRRLSDDALLPVTFAAEDLRPA